MNKWYLEQAEVQAYLNKHKASVLFHEIKHEPEIWKKLLTSKKDEIEKLQNELAFFLQEKRAQNIDPKIIIAGAGTSEYIGAVLQYALIELGHHAVSVATTDIVTNPHLYFNQGEPTILISVARSGNSPESTQALKEGARIMQDKLWSIALVCNANSKLALWKAKYHEKHNTLLMPPASNDQSLAMTCSFTTLILGVLSLFIPFDQLENNLEQTIEHLAKYQSALSQTIQPITEKKVLDKRIVIIGSQKMFGYCREASLKIVELSDGRIISVPETFVGFRHGPMALINNTKSMLVIGLMSINTLTRKYEIDLINQLINKLKTNHFGLLIFDQKFEPELQAKLKNNYVSCQVQHGIEDTFHGLAIIYVLQIFAMLMAIKAGSDPDNPAPEGVIHRVVQGVIVHDSE